MDFNKRFFCLGAFLLVQYCGYTQETVVDGTCYEDQRNPRILEKQIKIKSNTIEGCTKKCLDFGYLYAGVESGNECFCGNDKPSEIYITIKGTECNDKCPGESSQKCGGRWRINIYNTGFECDARWENGVAYPQNDLKPCKKNKKSSAEECQQFCKSIPECVGWEWGQDGKNCCAKSALENRETKKSGIIAGKRNSCAPGQARPGVLLPGGFLNKGYAIESLNNKHLLKMQKDGNLVVYRTADKQSLKIIDSTNNEDKQKFAIWHSGTDEASGCIGNIFKFQNDGNLVIYSSKNKVCWTSHTQGTQAKTLTLGNDGILDLESARRTYMDDESWGLFFTTKYWTSTRFLRP